MDNVHLIEQYELELQDLVERMHRDRIRYSVISYVIQQMARNLELQGYAEDWLDQYHEPTKRAS